MLLLLPTGSTSSHFALPGDHETQEEKEDSGISQCICTGGCSDFFIPTWEFITCALDVVKLVLDTWVDDFSGTLSLTFFFLCYKIL